jgi:hypothetical protein
MEHQNVLPDVAALLERIETSWRALDQDISRMSEEQLTQTVEEGGWAAKDHLAHLAAWEQKQLAVVEGRPAYAGLGIDEATFAAADIDGLNALIYKRHRDQAALEVLDTLRRSHTQLVAAIEGLSAADLARPDIRGDADSGSLLDGIVGNTYEHYDEHRAWIDALLSQITDQGL